MVILLGKTASGKDTILNKLTTEYGFKKIITYTTRPARQGEKQGVTYHFITEEDFKKKIEAGFFAEWKTYNTEFGIWYYGTSIKSLENANEENIIILTPDGYRDIIGKLENKSISIYVHADDSTIKSRLGKRGDDVKEAERRLVHDNEDFKGLEYEIDNIVYNNDGYKIDDVINNILEILN